MQAFERRKRIAEGECVRALHEEKQWLRKQTLQRGIFPSNCSNAL